MVVLGFDGLAALASIVDRFASAVCLVGGCGSDLYSMVLVRCGKYLCPEHYVVMAKCYRLERIVLEWCAACLAQCMLRCPDALH